MPRYPQILALMASVLSFTAVQAADSTDPAGRESEAAAVSAAAGAGGSIEAEIIEPDGPELPYPSGWSVENNPSVENSLSYLHESGDIAVNVTYIAGSAGQNISPEAYARVAAEQLNCDLPVSSNLIEQAWSFKCEQSGVEAIVYGQEGNLVLLSISGRNAETEGLLENFIRFLAYQSRRG